MNSTITGLGLLSLILQWPVLRAEQAEDFGRVIDANRHHLGDSDTPGWKDTKRKPEGFELKFVFEANRTGHTSKLPVTANTPALQLPDDSLCETAWKRVTMH